MSQNIQYSNKSHDLTGGQDRGEMWQRVIASATPELVVQDLFPEGHQEQVPQQASFKELSRMTGMEVTCSPALGWIGSSDRAVCTLLIKTLPTFLARRITCEDWKLDDLSNFQPLSFAGPQLFFLVM